MKTSLDFELVPNRIAKNGDSNAARKPAGAA